MHADVKVEAEVQALLLLLGKANADPVAGVFAADDEDVVTRDRETNRGFEAGINLDAEVLGDVEESEISSEVDVPAEAGGDVQGQCAIEFGDDPGGGRDVQ